MSLFNNAKSYIAHLQPPELTAKYSLMRSEWFLDSFIRVKRSRDVSYYSPELMEKIFKRHHFAAVLCIVIAFVFLILIGFFLDHKAFQIPAAASITLFFCHSYWCFWCLCLFLSKLERACIDFISCTLKFFIQR